MKKRVYISADYSELDGDRNVIDILHEWGNDSKHAVDYVDTAQVVSGSVSEDKDCRPCDLKAEFNRQINASSAVIFVIGDKTATRLAGSSCKKMTDGLSCLCTPYKQNFNGASLCKIKSILPFEFNSDINYINTYPYLKHEFLQAKKRSKNIIVIYNSLYCQSNWLPPYMNNYRDRATPFWIKNASGNRIGNYYFIKTALGFN